MSRPEMGDVLGALVDAIADGGHIVDPISRAGIVIDEVEIDLPLEGHLAVEDDKPVLRTAPPQTTMQTGFTAPAHRGRLHLVLHDGRSNARHVRHARKERDER